jgi:V8-like Glu-specific endopeptidase
MSRFSHSRGIAVLLSLPLSVGCSSTVTGGDQGSAVDSSDRLIGGVDAASSKFDAVGALVYDAPHMGPGPATERFSFCTGTLVAPQLVLTARHCIEDVVGQHLDGSSSITHFLDKAPKFVIGPDATAEGARAIEIESAQVCALPAVSRYAYCDVGFYRLKTAITDVKPFKMSTAAVAKSALGTHFSAMGYGYQDHLMTTKGTRQAGTVTILATEGAALKLTFPTLEAYLEAVSALAGPTYVDLNRDALAAEYEGPLLEGYQVATGAATDAHSCNGDSGGPLLARDGDDFVVWGVASQGHDYDRAHCVFGNVFAVFGPKAQDLAREAASPAPSVDPCASVSVLGQCDGDQAVRCSEAVGPAELVRTDCSLLGQHCREPTGTQPVFCGD